MLQMGKGLAPQFERRDGAGAVELVNNFFTFRATGNKLAREVERMRSQVRILKAFGGNDHAGEESGRKFSINWGGRNLFEHLVYCLGYRSRGEIDKIDLSVAFVTRLVVDVERRHAVK